MDPERVDTRLAWSRADDLADLLPLMRAYCAFYESDPSDDDLRAMSRAFLEEGAGGTQLIARDASGAALGHATVLWSWDTTLAQPLAVMEDLFVAAPARGPRGGCGADRGVSASWPPTAGCRGWPGRPRRTTRRRNGSTTGWAPQRDTWFAYRLPTDRPGDLGWGHAESALRPGQPRSPGAAAVRAAEPADAARPPRRRRARGQGRDGRPTRARSGSTTRRPAASASCSRRSSPARTSR